MIKQIKVFILLILLGTQIVFARFDHDIKSEIIKTPLGFQQIQEIHKTRYGNVLILSDTSVYVRDTIMYNKKILFHKAVSYVQFHSYFFVNNKEIILFSTGCGGSSCGLPDQFYFLIIGADKSVKIISQNDFYNRFGFEPTIQGNQIKIDLGYEDKKHKIAVLDRDKLTIKYIPSKKVPIKLESCEYLYEYSSEDCISYKKIGFDCEKYGRPYNGSSVVAMSWVTGLSNHPGFDASALNDACVKMCNTGVVVLFEEFKQNVCSIKE